MTKERQLFESAPIPRALATLAVPTIISQLITMIYNLADTFFIGTTNDPAKVAASSVAFVLVFATNCLSNLFGVGGGSLISRLLGQHRDKEASRVASFSFYGSIIISAVYSLVIWLAMEPLLYLLGADEYSISYAIDYAFWIVVVGAVPSTVGMTLSNLLRSEGFAKHASIGLGLGGVLNIILDPIFMFVILEPGNEVMGAAVATMLSNVAVMIYFLAVVALIRRRSVISLSPAKINPGRSNIVSLFAVGFPSALSSFFACLSSIVLNNQTSGYGKEALAAVGIVKKIDMLPMNVGMGLCQGMMPLVAYNYASGNYKRMKGFTDAARTAGVIFALCCIVAFELLSEPLVRIFMNEPITVGYGTQFLRIMCLAVPLMIANFQMCFTFQAMGMGKHSLFLSSLRQGLVNIPVMLIMNWIFGLFGLVWAQLISDTLTIVISFAFYHSTYKKLMKKANITT